MNSPLTEHARARMQQRGISPAALELLLDFGRETHDHRGARIVRFDKRSRRRALRTLGPDRYRHLERCFNAYAVVAADDAVVTVGHRYRPHRAQQPSHRSSPRARQLTLLSSSRARQLTLLSSSRARQSPQWTGIQSS